MLFSFFVLFKKIVYKGTMYNFYFLTFKSCFNFMHCTGFSQKLIFIHRPRRWHEQITEMLEWLILCVHYRACLSIIDILESLIYRVWFNTQYLVSRLPINIDNIFVHHRHVVTFKLTFVFLINLLTSLPGWHFWNVGMFSLPFVIQHVWFNTQLFQFWNVQFEM